MPNMSDDHTRVQEFFGARAADWDSRFPDDGPAYAAAVAELGLREEIAYSTRAAARDARCRRSVRPWDAPEWCSGPI